MNTNFAEYWKREVEPLAATCCKNYKLVELLRQATTEDQKKDLEQQMAATRIQDWEAVERISELVWFVRHNQYSTHCGSLSRIQGMKTVLNSQDYYDDVFAAQPDCDEAKNYHALGQKLSTAKLLLAELFATENGACPLKS